MSVGWPSIIKLRIFGRLLRDTFGEMPYLVGSATHSKTFRDVDVVVMMGDQKFFHWAGPHGMHGIRYQSLCAAFSALGSQLTDLNIDFKFQQVHIANKQHKGRREAIGIEIAHDWIDPDFPCDIQHFFPTAEQSLMKESAE